MIKVRFGITACLGLTSFILFQMPPPASASQELTRAQACQVQLATSATHEGPALTPAHELGPDITKWMSHEESLAPVFTAVSEEFITQLHENGAVVVTVGGTSINTVFSQFKDSAKVKYARPPQTIGELVSWIADAAEPELKVMAQAGRFKSGDAPILIVPMPGFVVENTQIVLPGNFGTVGNIENLPLSQTVANHAKLLPIAELVRGELANRAAKLGISADQLAKAKVYVANDALPIAANAAYTKLAAGERASVVFIGTGTGSAKVSLQKGNAFTMLSSEESQAKLGNFPDEILREIPPHLLLGARIAKGSETSKLIDSRELTLENISGGGRDLDDEKNHYKVANHLMGADTVALSLLLKEEEMPKWVKDRVGEKYDKYRKKVLKSFELSEKDLRKLLTYGSPDLALIDALKSGKFMDRKTLKVAAKAGSQLALKVMKAQDYAAGLVAGLIAMNVGNTPSGNVIPADLVYGTPDKDGTYQLKILVRASAGMSDWGHRYFYDEALKGIEDAKGILLKDYSYRRKLSALGYKAPKPKALNISVKRIYSEDLKEHPDFTGLDTFSGYLRSLDKP